MVLVQRATRTLAPPPVIAQLTLTPVQRPGTGVVLDLLDSPQLDPGLPRWTELERPRRPSVLRWDGRGVLRQTFTVMFSGAVGADGELGDVGPRYNALHELAMPSDGTEPPVCFATGVGYGTWPDYRWQVESLEPGTAWRRLDGRIGQISYGVALARWLPTDVLITAATPPSPAAASVARTGVEPATAASTRTYTVRSGDTLSRIAAQQLGNAARWREIATLNALRDPNVLRVGQVLKLP